MILQGTYTLFDLINKDYSINLRELIMMSFINLRKMFNFVPFSNKAMVHKSEFFEQN